MDWRASLWNNFQTESPKLILTISRIRKLVSIFSRKTGNWNKLRNAFYNIRKFCTEFATTTVAPNVQARENLIYRPLIGTPLKSNCLQEIADKNPFYANYLLDLSAAIGTTYYGSCRSTFIDHVPWASYQKDCSLEKVSLATILTRHLSKNNHNPLGDAAQKKWWHWLTIQCCPHCHPLCSCVSLKCTLTTVVFNLRANKKQVPQLSSIAPLKWAAM